MRRKRPKRRRERLLRRRRMPINVLASVITAFGLYAGIASIFAAVQGDYTAAAFWILAAVVCDSLDGTVARLTRSVSEFGKEFDSLSDVVSFGVAPAVLIYIAYLQEGAATRSFTSPMGGMVATFFVICGALRLARFNVFQSERQDLFFGLPIPAAGGSIAAFTLFWEYFKESLALEVQAVFWILGPYTVALSLLMVSNVRYPKKTMKLFILSPRKAFPFLVLCVVGIATFHYAREYSPSIVLFPLSLAYVLFGVGNALFGLVRRRDSVHELSPNEVGPRGEAHHESP
jgi:CDP-diacylglycerol---serine O-phosphatidyltransferase